MCTGVGSLCRFFEKSMEALCSCSLLCSSHLFYLVFLESKFFFFFYNKQVSQLCVWFSFCYFSSGCFFSLADNSRVCVCGGNNRSIKLQQVDQTIPIAQVTNRYWKGVQVMHMCICVCMHMMCVVYACVGVCVELWEMTFSPEFNVRTELNHQSELTGNKRMT